MIGERLGLIGVPTSAGAFAPGQEQAPAALREAGLVELLGAAGLEVNDRRDREPWRWRPDRSNRRAQNVGKVVEIVAETAERVAAATGAGEATLVLGGDCTVGIGTVAGHVAGGDGVGLVYFDLHADLNRPDDVLPGALDWMGLAHMLGVEGTVRELVEVGDRTPLLEPDQVVLLGWGSEGAQAGERDTVERFAIDAITVDDVRSDPGAAAARALELLEPRAERLLVHFDVDVIDFTDTPLSENPGRNEGVPYEDAIRALDALLASPLVCGVTVTELNPNHVEEGAGSIERLARDLARALGSRRAAP